MMFHEAILSRCVEHIVTGELLVLFNYLNVAGKAISVDVSVTRYGEDFNVIQ